jgi:hypothetical protein
VLNLNIISFERVKYLERKKERNKEKRFLKKKDET